jgi:hypothetical protein
MTADACVKFIGMAAEEIIAHMGIDADAISVLALEFPILLTIPCSGT